MTYFSRWDKRGLDHFTHEQITDPFRVLTVGLISLLWFGVLGVSKYDIACLFENVEYRDPVLASRFHAYIRTFVRGKPCGKFPQTSGERGKPLFLIFCPAVCISESNAGKDPGFVDIKPTAVKTKDFKSQ